MFKQLFSRPITLAMLVLALLLLSVALLPGLRVALLPNAPIPRLLVRVQWPGASAMQLENDVLQPLRSELNNLPALQETRKCGGQRCGRSAAAVRLPDRYAATVAGGAGAARP